MKRQGNPIIKVILQRLGLGLLTMFVVSMLIFFAVELLPGDIAQEILGQAATEETVAAMRQKLGLDKPPILRYKDWIGAALTGDLGESLASGRQVSQLISGRVVNTFFLAGISAALAVPLSLLLGILTALYRDSVFDRFTNVIMLTAISSPQFFVAYILIVYLAVKAGLFPSLSNIDPSMSLGEKIYYSFLPALTLTMSVVAYMMRMTRAAIIDILDSSYIEMAYLKGIKRYRIIIMHALPNALAPIINVVALNLAYLVVGVVISEVIFAFPGLGQLLVDSVSKRDVTVVQAACLIFAATYIFLNLMADIFSIITNPRLLHPR
ncbi:MAG: ABC transporter permease [Pseudomonadota bacterium]